MRGNGPIGGPARSTCRLRASQLCQHAAQPLRSSSGGKMGQREEPAEEALLSSYSCGGNSAKAETLRDGKFNTAMWKGPSGDRGISVR